MPRALVTGATGFIGPHLVRHLLAANCQVRCLVRRPARAALLQSLEVELAIGDVSAPDSLAAALHGVDLVFHLAGVTKTLQSGEMTAVNEVGARHLAEACARRTSPPVLVLVSSLAAAGPAPPGRLRSENDAPCPVSHYGRSKRAGELAAMRWASQIPLTIVRPPIVFGPGDQDFYRMFLPIAKWGIHPVPTRRHYRYSLIHAADLSALLWQAAQRGERVPTEPSQPDEAQGVYFAAHQESPSYAELGHRLAASMGKPAPSVWRAPEFMMWVTGLLGEVVGQLRRQPLIVNLDKARESTAGDWTCDPARARQELGFAPAPLDDRLRETADWYRAEGWL